MSLDKTMLFIYNPRSGKEKIKNSLSDILNTFTAGGYMVTVLPTQQKGDAAKWAETMGNDYDMIACSGGDGTLDEVVSGMIRGNVVKPLGYIPAGSTNDFAGSLKIPKNMKKAAEIIVEGKSFQCDVGTFNDSYFVYIAAFGAFTDVSYGTPQDIKNILGHTAYVLEGVRSLTDIKPYHMKITYDGNVIEDDFIYGMITNTLSVGGLKHLKAKEVMLDDGLFEVCLIKNPINALDNNNIASALWNGTIDQELMYTFTASEITVECYDTVMWTLDGEYGGGHTKIVAKNLQKAMDIRVK